MILNALMKNLFLEYHKFGFGFKLNSSADYVQKFGFFFSYYILSFQQVYLRLASEKDMTIKHQSIRVSADDSSLNIIFFTTRIVCKKCIHICRQI